MSCTDLSQTAKLSDDRHSELCAVCERVDFVSSTSNRCAPMGNMGHFHIGSSHQVASKEFCAGCRLILSALMSANPTFDTFCESAITIHIRFCQPDMPDSSWRLFNKEVNTDNRTVITPHMERLLEVTINEPTPSFLPKLAGMIVRTDETEAFDLTGLNATLHQPEETFNLRGRTVPPNPNIELIKHWVQFCDTQHDECCILSQSPANMQRIRLIDVQDNMIIRAASRGCEMRYVALSYVWGLETKPLLNRNNVLKCSSLNGLNELDIPRTISDAIQFVRSIGKRYLWVDSLCILQDDDDDKQQQLPIMDSIYKSAELVIVAAAGSDASAGLPGVGNTERRHSQRAEAINGIQFITVQPTVQHKLTQSIWNQRGWTFQEAMLPTRAIIFTEGQVYWACRSTAWREDINSEYIAHEFDCQRPTS